MAVQLVILIYWKFRYLYRNPFGVQEKGRIFVRSGAGIVADSIPEKEFQECINKAKAVVEAIKKAQQMAAYEEKENDDDTID